MKSHIQLKPQAEDYTRAIVCGSPERAEYFSKKLSNTKILAKNREYHSYIGSFEGQSILITSHGVGAAGAAICFNEMIDVGVQKIIRIGTGGALQDHLKIGAIVLPTGAVRCDGVSSLMVPVGYPAIPSPKLNHSLSTILNQNSTPHEAGILLTSDLFYPGVLDQNLELYSKAGVSAVEMEVSTLFVIGSLRKVETAALIVLDGNPLKWKEGQYDPSPDKLKSSMDICFETAVRALTAR